mmetsp:Transcript_8395/g.28529  ORF Transcript_8395/g.28529 Transcript_8395/m.28529 type:complete len:229 (+) Transcript_8395:78-764(+)
MKATTVPRASVGVTIPIRSTSKTAAWKRRRALLAPERRRQALPRAANANSRPPRTATARAAAAQPHPRGLASPGSRRPLPRGLVRRARGGPRAPSCAGEFEGEGVHTARAWRGRCAPGRAGRGHVLEAGGPRACAAKSSRSSRHMDGRKRSRRCRNSRSTSSHCRGVRPHAARCARRAAGKDAASASKDASGAAAAAPAEGGRGSAVDVGSARTAERGPSATAALGGL